MTLTLAWRSEGRLHLAADSRIKLGENKYADVGVKVIAVPVVVTDTGGPDGDGDVSVMFRQTYGFAYAGSFVNAGTFIEFISELLQNVQFAHRHISFEFRTVCDFLVAYSGRISTEICAYMAEHGRYEFVIAGFCPLEQRLRCAKFEFSYERGTATASYEEVLKKDGDYLAIGSGAKAAEESVRQVEMRPMLLVLNQVIDSGAVPSVGGDIQYGSFIKGNNFKVQGIVRTSVETARHEGKTYGPTTQSLFKYRGFQLYEDWNPADLPLWTTPNFVELQVPSNPASDAYFRRRHSIPVT